MILAREERRLHTKYRFFSKNLKSIEPESAVTL